MRESSPSSISLAAVLTILILLLGALSFGDEAGLKPDVAPVSLGDACHLTASSSRRLSSSTWMSVSAFFVSRDGQASESIICR